jgi:hypothetical protein
MPGIKGSDGLPGLPGPQGPKGNVISYLFIFIKINKFNFLQKVFLGLEEEITT